MENQLNCSLKLSLKEMALRKVVVKLWIGNDVSAIIEAHRGDFALKFPNRLGTSHDYVDVWQNYVDIWQNYVERQVKNKVSKLVLPNPLKKQLTSLVRPIGSAIIRWEGFHEYFLSSSIQSYFHYFSGNILKQLHWTCMGTIDYQKTAKELIRLRMLDCEKRYILACHYCFDEYIPLLWKELDEDDRARFYDGESMDRYNQLEYAWPYIVMGKESVLENIVGDSFNKYFFESEAISGNKAATEYFFQRLTEEEKDTALTRTVEALVEGNIWLGFRPHSLTDECLAEVLCYLLPMMGPEQQLRILREHPHEFLSCLLDWPWHDLFFEATNMVWEFLRGARFHLILENCGYYFPNLLQKLLRDGPCEFVKEFLSQECHHCHSPELCFFSKFFDNEDAESIEEVFRNASDEDRMNFASSLHFFELLYKLMVESKWHLVELSLHEAAKSKEDRKILKERFKKFLEQPLEIKKCSEGWSELSKEVWKQFFELLDEKEISTPNKRSLEAETLIEIKAKKSCN